jgi:hypothetical protein
MTNNLVDLDERFQALLSQVDDDGSCRQGEPCPPLITKEQ